MEQDDKDGNWLCTGGVIFGVSVMLELIRVIDGEDGKQRAYNPVYQVHYNRFQRDSGKGRYQTMKVPGFEGDYILSMRPLIREHLQ
jgi:hypothetical protein